MKSTIFNKLPCRTATFFTCALLLFCGAFAVQAAPKVDSDKTSGKKIKGPGKGFYKKNTKALVYTNDKGESLNYRFFEPKNYDPKKKYPIILSLHGAGSTGNDNSKHLRDWVAGWTGDDVQSKHPCFIVMPQTPVRSWSGQPWRQVSYSLKQTPLHKSMRLAKELLDKIVAEKSIDKNRIYVMGASMGGCGTWSFAMRYPDYFAAAVPVCGNADPSMAKAVKDLPIWAFHGDQDTTVPFQASVEMVGAIKKAGGTKVKFTVYPGVAHSSYKLFWQEQDLVDWLFAQKKSK